MKRVISVLLENRFGSFNRVTTMFSGKGFNLHSISVGKTEHPDISRMTIVTSGDNKIIDQVIKQLNRLIDTLKVIDLSEENFVERELALISVQVKKGTRQEITELCNIFQGKVVDITANALTLEITGPPEKIDAAINLLSEYTLKEVARSGVIALKRSEQAPVKVTELNLS